MRDGAHHFFFQHFHRQELRVGQGQGVEGKIELAGRQLVQHRLPLPCTVRALLPQLHTYDR